MERKIKVRPMRFVAKKGNKLKHRLQFDVTMETGDYCFSHDYHQTILMGLLFKVHFVFASDPAAHQVTSVSNTFFKSQNNSCPYFLTGLYRFNSPEEFMKLL